MTRFKPWTTAAVVIAAILYAAACSRSLYEATSPFWLSWHIVLRKVYSIVAFAVVGYLARRALGENGVTRRIALRCIAGVAVYSAAIEVGQYLRGSQEGLGWNAFDTLCGALGGALATIDLLRRRTPLSSERAPARPQR